MSFVAGKENIENMDKFGLKVCCSVLLFERQLKLMFFVFILEPS